MNKVCDGDCFNCKYEDCVVPAVNDVLVAQMTGGGVKQPYVFRIVKSKE